MPRQRPTPRVVIERSSDNPKRALRAGKLSAAERKALGRRVRYEGYAKHKWEPRRFGLEPIPEPSEDRTFCDAHAKFRPTDMRRVVALLRRGVQASLVSDKDRQGDPAMIWTIADDGWIFEARLTLAGQALYHAYPLLPGDAFAHKVIEAFADYVYAGAGSAHHAALANAQERYAR